MSTCISRHGEFGSHDLDELHTCKLCHVLDEDALREELRKLRAANSELAISNDALAFQANAANADLSQLRAELVMLRADEEHSNSDIERLNGEVLRAWGEVRHREKQLDRLTEQRDQVLALLDEDDRVNTFPGGDLATAMRTPPVVLTDAIRAAYSSAESTGTFTIRVGIEHGAPLTAETLAHTIGQQLPDTGWLTTDPIICTTISIPDTDDVALATFTKPRMAVTREQGDQLMMQAADWLMKEIKW